MFFLNLEFDARTHCTVEPKLILLNAASEQRNIGNEETYISGRIQLLYSEKDELVIDYIQYYAISIILIRSDGARNL